jgi:phage shock protein PspC (stress-responsive transcriptional regulator)
MQKVVIINLNGRAYQLDEAAYDALRAYLDRAEAQLAANPDRAEIVSDLEQAIAEKCDRYLGPTKNVVTAPEIAQVIEEMGPVHDPAAAEKGTASEGTAEASQGPRPDPNAPRRLYRIREGALIAGICNGFAAYFNMDVTVVRVLAVVLAVLTSGGMILVYGILMFVLPEATTGEERAHAHGQPFNAQELIDRVKASVSFPPGSGPWFGNHGPDMAGRIHARRAYRAQRRAERRAARAHAHAAADGPVDYAGQVAAGFIMPVVSIISAALFVGLLLAIISLVTTGTLLDWTPPLGMPLWVQIVMLVIVYHMIAWPLHIVSHGPFRRWGGPAHGWLSVWSGILWTGFTLMFMWLAYQYFPGVKDFIDHFPDSLHRATDTLNVLIERP